MSALATKYFGNLDYSEESVFEFPLGIPGFDKEKKFLFVEQPLARLDRSGLGRIAFYEWLRPFVVGLVHGLAGSAAAALMVLSIIREPAAALGYLLLFGLGTIVGMMLITTAIATPFMAVSTRASWLHQALVTGSGLLSLGFGLFVCYQIGFVDGLFTSHPNWTPS